jgi:hypothetical protein
MNKNCTNFVLLEKEKVDQNKEENKVYSICKTQE